MQFAPGSWSPILGCNGSGKTLTLHTLAGLRPRTRGEVRLDGSLIRELCGAPRRCDWDCSPQDLEDAFVTTVLEMVLIGRHPHLSLWQWETAETNGCARKPWRR